MSRVFAPRIRKIFDEREATIGGAIASAKQVQAEAAAQAEAARQALADARATAQKTAADAKAKADAEAKAQPDALEAELDAKLGAAEAAIRAARDAAMSNVNAVASRYGPGHRREADRRAGHRRGGRRRLRPSARIRIDARLLRISNSGTSPTPSCGSPSA